MTKRIEKPRQMELKENDTPRIWWGLTLLERGLDISVKRLCVCVCVCVEGRETTTTKVEEEEEEKRQKKKIIRRCSERN